MAIRLSATPAARAAIRQLRVAGKPVMFVQSAGCCAGSTPMCFPAGEYLVGDRDTCLGDVDGAPFYIDAHLDAALGHPDLTLDVADGPPEGFSLSAGNGQHFVATSGSCSGSSGP
jgi:uncharacterized protein (DUF779 family)